MSQIIGQSESGNRDYLSSGAPVVSPAGARFKMQVMPSTARDPGFGIQPARDASAAEYNRVGEAYWPAMLKRYGSYPKMLGAYNAGPGRVDALSAAYGEDWLRHAPPETQAYVADNMRRLRVTGGQ